MARSRDYFASKLMFFTSDEDKLNLRLVSKAYHSAVHGALEPPYKTKAQFVIGIGGLFYDEAHLQTAWFVYNSTVTSTSTLPAILYKIADMDDLKLSGELSKFAKQENLTDTGRIYSPAKLHAWDVNQVWLLAQTHMGRSFVVYSELTPAYVMRRNYVGIYSAFAKEVATAIKAGYTIGITKEGRIRLDAPKHNEMARQLTVEEISVSNDEVKSGVKKVNDAKEKYKEAIKAAREIKKLFNEAESADIVRLEMAQFACEGLVKTLVDSFDGPNNKHALSAFVDEYYSNKPYFAPSLENDYSLYSIPDASTIKKPLFQH